MAMRETQIQFGGKYIMLVATDLSGTLGLCYSNKEIERHMRESLTGEQKEKIRDPKRNYLTLFEKLHKKSTGANNKKNTRRKVKNGLRRFYHARGFPPPVLAREEMVPYKHMQNLAELRLGSTHTVVAVGHIEHYGQQKLVVKLGDGILYQAGENLEQQKEQLKNGCNIIINKVRVNNSICKIVQRRLGWCSRLRESASIASEQETK